MLYALTTGVFTAITLIQSEKMSAFFIAISQNSGTPFAGDDEPSSFAFSARGIYCLPHALT